jgi:hypothetical protein
LAAQCSNPTQVPDGAYTSGDHSQVDNNALSAANFGVSGDATATFVAGKCIQLLPGFHASAIGATVPTTFHAWVETVPSVISASPSTGSGTSQQFSWTVSSPSGYANLAHVYALFNTSVSGVNGCYLSYSPSANLLFLADNSGSAWTGGFSPGSSNSASNSYCTIYGSGSSVSASANQLALTVNVAFSSSFSGTWNNYLLAQDNAGLTSEWQWMGTWTVATALPQDFTLTANPGVTVLDYDGSGYFRAAYTIAIGSLNGFNQSVNLSVSGVPDGVTPTLSPATLPGSGTATLTLSTPAASPAIASSNTLTITASSTGFANKTYLVTATVLPIIWPASASVRAGSVTRQFEANHPCDYALSVLPAVNPNYGSGYVDSYQAQGSYCIVQYHSPPGMPGVSTISIQPPGIWGYVWYGGHITLQSSGSGISINPDQVKAAPAAGGPGSFTVTADPPIPWTAGTDSPGWIQQISPASGSVTTTVSYTLTANNTGVTRTGRITVNGLTLVITQDSALSITTNSTLPNGTVQTAYSQQLAAGGGKPDYRWTILSGAPSWLSLNATTGVLSGTPASNGTYNSIVINVTDGVGASSNRTFSISVGTQGPPQPLSVTPSAGAGSTEQFQFVYSEPAGASAITKAYFLFQTSQNTVNACYGYYDQTVNAFYLSDDSGTAWDAAIWQTHIVDGIQVGAYNKQLLQNSQCVLRAQASWVQTSGNTLTVNVQLDFKGSFANARNIYLSAADRNGQNRGWQQLGGASYTVQTVQFNRPATAMAIIPFLPMDLYTGNTVGYNVVTGCPNDGHTTMRQCIQDALAGYSHQGVTGVKIAFGFCGGAGNTALSNCGDLPSRVHINSAWQANMTAFLQDIHNAANRCRSLGLSPCSDVSMLAISPLFTFNDDRIENDQLTCQVDDCRGQPLAYGPKSLDANWPAMLTVPYLCNPDPDNPGNYLRRPFRFAPAGPFAFTGPQSGDGPWEIGPIYTVLGTRETYTCSPRNPIFVGWDNLLGVIDWLLTQAAANYLTVNELELPGEMDFSEGGPVQARYIYDTMNVDQQDNPVEVYQRMRDLMSAHNFQPGNVTIPAGAVRVQQPIAWSESCTETNPTACVQPTEPSFDCSTAFGDSAQVQNLSEYAAALDGAQFGFLRCDTCGSSVQHGFVCGGNLADPALEPLHYVALPGGPWPQPTMLDVHVYPCVTYGEDPHPLECIHWQSLDTITAESKKTFNAIKNFINNHYGPSSNPTIMIGEGHGTDRYRDPTPTFDGNWTLTCDGDGSPGYGAVGLVKGFNESNLSGSMLIYRPWSFPAYGLPFDPNIGCWAFPGAFDPPYRPNP